MSILKKSPESGQAIVLLMLGIVGLIGITALAIDGGNAFSDRRHAQNAADTAAFAGALAKVNQAPDWKFVALDRAASNGYSDGNPDPDSNGNIDVQVHSPPISGPYTGNDEFVQVIIRSMVPTYFGAVVGVDSVTNRVNAVALAKPAQLDSTFMGSALMALRDTCLSQPGFKYGGKSETYINGGGIFVNADCTGFQQTGCPGTLFVETPPGLVSVGDAKFPIDDKCKNPVLNGDVTTGADPVLYPPLFSVPKPSCGAGVIVDDTIPDTTVLGPGTYDSMPPNKVGGVNVEANVVLMPGEYCVEGPFKMTTGSLIAKPDEPNPGVMFYISAYNSFDISGGTVDIFAQTHNKDTNEYYGLLIYVDPGTYNKNPVPTCIINGNETLSYAGTIFAPYCKITLNGTGDSSNPYSFASQVIGYEITLEGNANFTINYDKDLGFQFKVPPQLELSE